MTWTEQGKLVFFAGNLVYRFTTYKGALAHATIMNNASYHFEYRVLYIDPYYFIGVYDNGVFWTYH